MAKGMLLDPSLLKAPADGSCGEASLVLLPAETLLFDSRDGDPVDDKRCGSIAVIRVDSDNQHSLAVGHRNAIELDTQMAAFVRTGARPNCAIHQFMPSA